MDENLLVLFYMFFYYHNFNVLIVVMTINGVSAFDGGEKPDCPKKNHRLAVSTWQLAHNGFKLPIREGGNLSGHFNHLTIFGG